MSAILRILALAVCLALILVYSAPLLAQPPEKRLTRDDYLKLKAFAAKSIDRKIVAIEDAQFKPNGGTMNVLPPTVSFGAVGKDQKADNIRPLFQYLLLASVVQKSPFPAIPKATWASEVAKKAELTDDDIERVNTLEKKDFTVFINRKTKDVEDLYADMGMTKEVKVNIQKNYVRIVVDFETIPANATIYMVSVMDYELEEFRGGKGEDLLKLCVVTPRTMNSNYAGDVYYKLDRNGQLDANKKMISILKSGQLPLP